MSDLASAELQIPLNGEEHEPQQDDVPCSNRTENLTSSASLDEEDKEEHDQEAHVKMQSILQQVRKQIRIQGGVRTPKSSILALVQKVWEKEVENAHVNGGAEVEHGSGEEEKQVETDTTYKQEDTLTAILEEKIEASKKALREEIDVQVLQLRKEMRAYMDQVVKELECKILSSHDVEKQKHSPNKKQSSSAAPPMALRRGRVLTRTMTTIIPKTCTPVIMGPRAKSETLSSSKNQLVGDTTVTSTAANHKAYQNRRPLPPAGPRQPKRQAQAKAKTGN